MPSGTVFTGAEPYLTFLSAYPFPAFVLDASHRRGNHGTSLQPVYGNSSYADLVFGPEAPAILAARPLSLGGLVESLPDVDEARRFSAWVQSSAGVDNTVPKVEHTIVLSLRPPWLPIEHDLIRLHVTKTFLQGFWVCTSTPQGELPRVPISSSTTPRKNSPNLKIPNFPSSVLHPATIPQSRLYIGNRGLISPPHAPVSSPYAISPLPTTTVPSRATAGANPLTQTVESMPGILDLIPQESPGVPSSRQGGMEHMVETFDWEKTTLGPRSGWPQSLKTALSICLHSPSSCALWWGPSLVLIYNDKYAEMACSKHPRIFGKHGSEAFSELWEMLGPVSELVLGGQSVAKLDDLLFFERLTSADLPEELYHTWNWIPVTGEDSKVVGIINWSIETTQKVIAQRRLVTLRTMGERTKLAKSIPQLVSALLFAFEKNLEDAPFAAFYYCQTPTPQLRRPEPGGNGSSTSYIRSSTDQPPLQLTFTLSGSIGIPAGHTATPSSRELFLDPVTLRPSPSIHPRPSPSHTVRDPSPVPALNLNLGRVTSPTSNMTSASPGTSVTSLPSAATGRDSPSLTSEASLPSPRSTKGSESSLSTTSPAPWTWPIAEAIASRRPVLVTSLPPEVAESLSRRAWGDIPRQAVVVPVSVYEGEGAESILPKAVLVLGLNPRRPYDRDYEEWVDVLQTSLGVSLAAVLSWEAETQRAEQLAQLDAAKTSFFSNASHELRTPLTLILGPLQDAVTDTSDSKTREKLKLALRNVTRLSRLVDSLMDFTRLEAGRLLGHFKPVQLGVFTADLAALFRSTIEKSNIKFIVQCDSSPSLCYVDPDLWEKIVFNLIGNAFKYTLQGVITVRVVYHTNEVVFTVEDTGVGIPNEDIGRIFQRFHRVFSICRSHEGTGIGLSLTKELVRLHGGTISALSRTEGESFDGSHGSIFTVTIPLGKDHLPAGHVNEESPDIFRYQHYARGVVEEASNWLRPSEMVSTPSESSESSGSSSEGSRLDSGTLFFVKKDIILLVDDNSDMRKYIKSIFEKFCTVVEAAHGQEALDLIDNGLHPHLILSDVMMPVLDGYALMKTIRERPDTKLLPILLLTARAGEESRVEGLLSGADDYIAKPFQARELVARVHLQMQLGKRRVELEARFEERQREIQILSDHSPIGIVRTDPHGRITYVNSRWFELTGTSDDSLDNWIEKIHPEHADAMLSLWREVFEQRCEGSSEFRWSNGVWTKGQIVPLGIETNSWTGMLFTITDISDQRLYEAAQLSHAQEREATARRRAEEAEERRKEADERRRGQELLIDVTSHELRQPVSAILNCSAIVRQNLAALREELSECDKRGSTFVPRQAQLDVMKEDLEALDSIYQCGLAQERIANDVLSLSRIQLQVLSIHPVEFELVPEVRQIVAIFNNEVKMKKIKLTLQFGKSIQKLQVRRVRSDKSRFAQVLTNLLSNAIKFTDTSINKREIQVNVDVSFKPPENGTCIPPNTSETSDDLEAPLYIYVAVKDSGPGLKPDDLTRLFKRFQQGSNSHDVFGGSGLGLFVSRKLCELMRGRIDFDSTYGEGATFRFFIQATNSPMGPHPRDTSNSWKDNVDVETDPSNKYSEIAKAHETPPLAQHILITEDNLINQTVLNRQLKGAGFATTLASHGRQALDRIRALAQDKQSEKPSRRLFDAILMDCEMPVMDGLAAVREIRRMEASGELPGRNRIFALTGNARSGQVQSAREAGMDDVLIKPYKLDELLSKLRQQ